MRHSYFINVVAQDAAQFKTAFEDGQKKNASLAAAPADALAPHTETEAKPAEAKTVAPAEDDSTAPTTGATAEAKAEDAAEAKDGDSHATGAETTPAEADAGAE
jgi:hypothetical protein